MMLDLSHKYFQNINLLMLRFEKNFMLIIYEIVDLEGKKKRLDSGPLNCWQLANASLSLTPYRWFL